MCRFVFLNFVELSQVGLIIGLELAVFAHLHLLAKVDVGLVKYSSSNVHEPALMRRTQPTFTNRTPD